MSSITLPKDHPEEPEVLPDGWRPVQDFADWDYADVLRTSTIRDNPTLDVRVRYEGRRYWVDVRGDGK